MITSGVDWGFGAVYSALYWEGQPDSWVSMVGLHRIEFPYDVARQQSSEKLKTVSFCGNSYSTIIYNHIINILNF